MATVYGDGVFGMVSESALGMYANDFSMDLSADTETMAGEGSDDIGLAVFNEGSGTFSLTGFQKSTGTIGVRLVRQLRSPMLRVI